MLGLPTHPQGARIGLFGGSFNPPHEAHRAASLLALKKLALDRVWWIVSPGNPLKDTRKLPSLAQRMAAAERMADDRRIVVTGFESAIGTRYTADTIAYLRRHCPGVKFVWLMGADNLVQFHRWQNWRGIAQRIPIAVIDRPPAGLRAMAAPAAQSFAKNRIAEHRAPALADLRPPAWVFLHGLKSELSSTELRRAASI